jgi:hypothetical protein
LDRTENSPPGAPVSLADPSRVGGQYFNKFNSDAATSKRARDAEFGKARSARTEALLGLHHAEQSSGFSLAKLGERDAGMLWLLAVACTAALLMLTVTWFGPTNSQFASRSLPMDQVPVKLDPWLMLYNLRIALAAAASVLDAISTSR